MVAGNYQRKKGMRIRRTYPTLARKRAIAKANAAGRVLSRRYKIRKSRVLALNMTRPQVFGTLQKSVKRTQNSDTRYTADKFVVGYKPKHNMYQAFKLLELMRKSCILRFQGVNLASSGQEGYYKLWTSSLNGIKYLPLHIIDVTSVINRVNSTNVAATPGYRPQIDALNGEITFVNLPNTDSSGNTVATGAWIVDSTDNDTANNSYPGDKSILDWIQLKFRLWAPLLTDTRFNIQLIQFTDEDCRPERNPTVHSANRTALFQYLVKPFTFNGISVSGSEQQKKYKVLRNYDYYMQLANDDNSRQRRDVSLFMRMNRNQDYTWARNDYISNGEQLVADDDFVQNIGDTQVTVNPRARIYMMIRASATSHALDWDGTIHPSYDMILRTKHSFSAY